MKKKYCIENIDTLILPTVLPDKRPFGGHLDLMYIQTAKIPRLSFERDFYGDDTFGEIETPEKQPNYRLFVKVLIGLVLVLVALNVILLIMMRFKGGIY